MKNKFYKNKLFYISFIIFFIFGCFNSNEQVVKKNNEILDLPKVECTNNLEAYIFQAKSLDQDGIDLIEKWICESERLFFDETSSNWDLINPVYIAALDRNNVNSAIELEKKYCEHLKEFHNSQKSNDGYGNNGYDNGKCNPKNYNPKNDGCDFGLCLFTEPNGRVAGSSISSNMHSDGHNLFISNSHDLPMHSDSYGYVTIHEMFHIYQYSNLHKNYSRHDLMKMVGKLGTGSNPDDEVPWWIEGNAVFFGYYKYAQLIDDHEWFINIMRDSIDGYRADIKSNYLINGMKINEYTWKEEEKDIGYELGAWFVAFIIDKVGEESIYKFWRGLESEGKFDLAFEKYFGKKYEEYVDEFDDFLRRSDMEILSLLDRLFPDPITEESENIQSANSDFIDSKTEEYEDNQSENLTPNPDSNLDNSSYIDPDINTDIWDDRDRITQHYAELENYIPKDYFAQEIITSTDVPETYTQQYYEVQSNLNSIIGSYDKYKLFITTTNEFSQPVFDKLKEVGWEHPLEINLHDNGKYYLENAGCLTGSGGLGTKVPDPYGLCIMDYEFIQYPHFSREEAPPLSERQAIIYHGWAHEYFHHYQGAHARERSLGMTTDCCGGRYHVNAPAWWVEGAAIIFPNLWLRHHWKDFSEFDGLEYMDVEVEMMNLDNFYIESKKEMQELKPSYDPNRKPCTEFTEKESSRETAYCNWAIFNAYLAYISSYQALWVGIPRDYHELGFDESFKKHIGMTIEEAYESYNEFMRSEDPDAIAPPGFFPKGPLTNYSDFFMINSSQEAYDSRLEELKKYQFKSTN